MVPFIVIAYSILVLVVVIMVLWKKGKESDNNIKRLKSIGKNMVKEEYKNVDTSFYERVIKPLLSKHSHSEDDEKKKTKSARQKQELEQLAKQLRLAGLHISPSSFKFFKNAFTIVTAIVFFGLGLALISVTDYFFLVILVGLIIALLGPNLYLQTKTKQHQDAIKYQLADTLDLMSVCMEAGLSFDASLVKISERMDGPLIDELVTVFREIQLGKNRNDALKDLSNSTNVPELKTFVSAVIQANQLGIPITNVLAAQSEQLRVAKREEIKTVAAKVPTKMTLPTVLLILPAIICIIMGPVIIQVKDQLSGMSLF